MGSRKDIVMQIAPPAPPCFASRLQWLEYLGSAAESQKTTRLFDDSRAVVLLIEEGKPRINPQFAYCRDCSAQHSHAMLTAGKCKPGHLAEQLAATAPGPFFPACEPPQRQAAAVGAAEEGDA